MIDRNKIVIECQCGTHIVKVEQEDDFGCCGERGFYFAMFHYGSKGISLKQRLKHCLRIIRKGDPYADQITMSPSEAKYLADFIYQYLPKKAKQ